MARPEDSEIRTIESAKVATTAFFSGYHVRWVISPGVEGGGERQHARGAKLDAKAAALAPLNGDVNGSLGHLRGSLHANGHAS
jgi:hypothetical protein